VGAGIHNGLGLRLPFPSTAVARAYRRIGGGNASVPTIYSSDGELLIRVVNDLRTTFAVGGEAFVNTRIAEAVRAPISITLLIELNQTVALSAAEAPFDLFLYHAHDPSHEIHRSMYGGTEWMDTSLFGTMSDGSTETRHFVNDRGVPFVLDVPQSTLYPLEQRPIDWLYPDILVFGTSGGASARTYYATNVQGQHAYTGDVFGAARAQPVVPPRVEVYAAGCQRVVE
jgi:LruC domain-containing protein